MTPSTSERAILVGLEIKGRPEKRLTPPSGAIETTAEESLEELEVLARSAGAEVLQKTIQSRPRAETSTLIGSGKVEELARDVQALSADMVLFDYELTPTQQRNLENALDCKVIDRTQLILDIFASRARTREGQLQVELAQLNYLLPRLTGRGAAMSRLGGGIGTRGPGETKLETDRRRIFVRKKKLEDELEHVRRGRSVQRQQRQAVPLLTVSLVGYTNAGKSTLFNRLTGSGVLADARMFATLDPTVRQLILPSRRRVLLSDTVGFIRNLPTTLVSAFRATLEEVKDAALLLHVVDVSEPQAPQQTEQVIRVLTEIGAESTSQLLVLNKVDRMPPGELDLPTLAQRLLVHTATEGSESRPPANVTAISAATGQGLGDLLTAIDRLLPADPVTRRVFRFPAGAGDVRHLIHEYSRVLSTEFEGDTCIMETEAPESLTQRLKEYVA